MRWSSGLPASPTGTARSAASWRWRICGSSLTSPEVQEPGISSSDLLQEGFCGLLRAIDRFQPGKETPLASYAVWWFRQSLQRAVAAGAYPVRLNPRHLQQLAQNNSDRFLKKAGSKNGGRGRSTTIQQIPATGQQSRSTPISRR